MVYGMLVQYRGYLVQVSFRIVTDINRGYGFSLFTSGIYERFRE